MPKQVLTGKEARAALLRGVEFIVGPVAATLGPGGRLALISRRGIGQTPISTKDGVKTSNCIDPLDPFEQIGSDIAREAAQKTVEHAGDGTTTTMVLVRALVRAGIEQLDAGKSPAELERGIKSAVAAVVDALEKMALPADGERLAQVATISANGDAEIGRLVHEAINRVGKDGVLICEESRSLDTYLDVVSGMQIKQGYRSPYFMNDPERQECVLENCLILLHEGKLGAAKSLVNVLNLAMGMHQPLLVIAGDYEPEALNLLVINRIKQNMPLCAIRADAWGPRRAEILRDIAVLTDGKALTDDTGIKLENVTADFFGKAKRIVVTEHRTTIMEGAGDEKAIRTRAGEIRTAIENETQPDISALLSARLAGLAGGMAVVRVGGAVESEMKEKKDRVEDALYATKAAAEDGIVPGGGLALTFAAKCLASDHWMNGIFESPLRQILANAGLKAPLVFSLDSFVDSATGEVENFLAAGIIDPVLVVKEALKNAAAVACVILKTESLISDIPESK